MQKYTKKQNNRMHEKAKTKRMPPTQQIICKE